MSLFQNEIFMGWLLLKKKKILSKVSSHELWKLLLLYKDREKVLRKAIVIQSNVGLKEREVTPLEGSGKGFRDLPIKAVILDSL